MRRIRLKKKHILFDKKRKPLKKSSKIILFIFLIILFIVLSFFYINKKTTPILMKYAEVEISKLSNLIITRTISKQMTGELNLDNLFIIDKGINGEINTIDFDPKLVNKVLANCTSAVQVNLQYVEQGRLDLVDIPELLTSDYQTKNGIIYYIPSGVVFNNSVLSNLGPKIPVRLNPVGNIEGNIHTKITDYGINNALIEVFVTIKIDEQIILPFSSKIIKVETDIPVAIKIINGKVPESYFGMADKSSTSFSIPVE